MNKTQRPQIGQLVCSLFLIAGGAGGIMTGQAGFKFGYANGTNVRVGAICVFIAGCWLLVDFWRKHRAE